MSARRGPRRILDICTGDAITERVLDGPCSRAHGASDVADRVPPLRGSHDITSQETLPCRGDGARIAGTVSVGSSNASREGTRDCWAPLKVGTNNADAQVCGCALNRYTSCSGFPDRLFVCLGCVGICPNGGVRTTAADPRLDEATWILNAPAQSNQVGSNRPGKRPY